MKKRYRVVASLLAAFLLPVAMQGALHWLPHRGPQLPLWRHLATGAMLGGMMLLVLVIPLIVQHFFLNGDAALKAADIAISAGQSDEAARWLETLNPRRMSAFRRRHAALIRAGVDYQRGEIDRALAGVDLAIDGPTALLESRGMKASALRARGLRALLRAAKGDVTGARADIAVVRATDSGVEARARAALAEGMLLDRAGDHDGGRAHLARERGLLVEGLSPGERAIARGILRKSSGIPASPYRHKAGEPARGEQGISEWIQRLAPGVALYLAPPRAAFVTTSTPPEIESAPGGAARAAVEAARGPAAPFVAAARERRMARMLLSGIGLFFLVGLMGARWIPSRNGDVAALGLLATLMVPTLGFIAATTWQSVKRGRHVKTLTALEARLVVGDHDGLSAALAEIAALPHFDLAAIAERHLADLAFQQGDFDAALSACDRCLARLSALHTVVRTRGAGSTETLARCAQVVERLDPEIAALRASVLAALGRADEAAVEIEHIPTERRAITQDRVRIFRRLRIGDLEGASQLVARRPLGLRIDLRDEALSDLIVAAVSADDGELAALQDEIAADPVTERWIRGVAPELLARRGAADPGATSARRG